LKQERKEKLIERKGLSRIQPAKEERRDRWVGFTTPVWGKHELKKKRSREAV